MVAYRGVPPPPTRFGPTVQRKAAPAGPTRPPPPPTRFGPKPVQAMLGGGGSGDGGRDRDVDKFLYSKDGNLRHGMGVSQERQFLQAPKNPGQVSALDRYVYHSTSWRNLVNIRRVGLDPGRGGSGGSCDLCTNEPLRTTSIANSQNRIAVAVDRLTMGTYINQREDYADSHTIGCGGMPGVEAANSSVLLRFRVSARMQHFHNRQRTMSSTWSKDPDDQRAWHLTGIGVPPSELEVLLPQGWVPLEAVDARELTAMLTPPPPNSSPLPNPWAYPPQMSPEEARQAQERYEKLMMERRMMAFSSCGQEARRDFRDRDDEGPEPPPVF